MKAYEVRRAARALVPNGILSLNDIRITPKRNRGFPIEDLRRIGYTYPQLRFLLLLIFDTFPPIPKNGPNNQRVEIEEVCIPRVLREYAPNLSGLSVLWRPDQSTMNFFSQETARAASTVPPFTPYPVLDLSKKPWVPAEPGQEKAVAAWVNKMRGLESTQPLNMQSFIYYRIRSLFAGDLARAFDRFGGLIGQINLLGVILRLAIVESPFVAMEYDRAIQARLSSMARERYLDCDRVDFSHFFRRSKPISRETLSPHLTLSFEHAGHRLIVKMKTKIGATLPTTNDPTPNPKMPRTDYL